MPATTRADDDAANDPAEDESRPLRDLQLLLGGRCCDCGQTNSAREAVCSMFLGLKDAPRCLACLSRRLERPPAELRADLLVHIRARDCYLQAWQAAERIDGITTTEMTMDPPTHTINSTTDGDELPIAAEWDAGDMGCGDLVMALRGRIGTLGPGKVIRVTATDPASPEDLPAWCRLCGHTLVAMNHPHYWIRRKGD